MFCGVLRVFCASRVYFFTATYLSFLQRGGLYHETNATNGGYLTFFRSRSIVRPDLILLYVASVLRISNGILLTVRMV